MFPTSNITPNGFQATLSATTSSSSGTVFPHHPIQCASKLYFNEDNSFECEHARAEPDDVRTQQCVTHSIASLIIELAYEKY